MSPLYSAIYRLIYRAELTVATWDERSCQSFKTAPRGFEPGFFRLRGRCSNRKMGQVSNSFYYYLIKNMSPNYIIVVANDKNYKKLVKKN